MISRKSFKEINERERLNSNNKKSSEDLQLLNQSEKPTADKYKYFRKASQNNLNFENLNNKDILKEKVSKR